MVFSSALFLFIFLPLVLLAYYLVRPAWRNTVLLAFSLIFYAWGEGLFVMLMLASIGFNYGIARWILHSALPRRKCLLALGVTGNLLALFAFKYATFILNNIVLLVSGGNPESLTDLPTIHLPIGISFFTFQAMSFLIDVYRSTVAGTPRFLDCALYICLFPQLIAGPIVRYHHVARQIRHRTIDSARFATGVQRFILGLAKKVLMADTAGLVADHIFDLTPATLTPGLSWLAVLAYSLQIYFDFSGYSDMAIGLGQMFGFQFQENFNYPYVSRSIREFWRRWHISLSTWFRDYLYIPLGGSRGSTARTLINLWIVFVLCGLWHGAAWNFLIWGMLHGVYLILERTAWGRWQARLWRPLQHVYTLLLVAISWVFFRSETLAGAWTHLKAMFFISSSSVLPVKVLFVTEPARLAILGLGCILCMPIGRSLHHGIQSIRAQAVTWQRQLIIMAYYGTLLVLFIVSISSMASNTYTPFIYFRF